MATKTKTAEAWTIEAGGLARALAAVKPAISGKPLRAILANVFVGHGEMIATDLEMAIAVTLTGDVADAGGPAAPQLLPFARLAAIAKSVFPVQALQFAGGAGETLTVKATGSRWSIPTEAPDDFPTTLAAGDLRPVARIPCDQFARGVASVAIAADGESGRYSLGGVLLDVADGVVNLVATDGRRLSLFEIAVDQAVDDSTTVVPVAAIRAAAALAAGDPGAVQLERGTAHVVLSGGTWRVESRILEGAYPKWRKVVPSRDVAQTVVSRAELLAAVAAARVCTDEVSKGVTFKFGSDLRLHSQSSAIGEAKVKCDVVEAGKEVTVKLDPAYVADWLRTLDAKDADPAVTIDADTAGAAVVFRCDDATNVVMPLGDA